MKRFRWKIAIATFLIMVIINALLLWLDTRHPSNAFVHDASRIVQLPALPLFVLPIPIPSSLATDNDYTLYAIFGCFSALVWGVLAALIFRRERAT